MIESVWEYLQILWYWLAEHQRSLSGLASLIAILGGIPAFFWGRRRINTLHNAYLKEIGYRHDQK